MTFDLFQKPGLLSLLLVDELHEDPLVPEHVTLGLQVKLVVQVTVDLLGLPARINKLKQETSIKNYIKEIHEDSELRFQHLT